MQAFGEDIKFVVEAIVVTNTDYFLMINRLEEFNNVLNQTIKSIIENELNCNKYNIRSYKIGE